MSILTSGLPKCVLMNHNCQQFPIHVGRVFLIINTHKIYFPPHAMSTWFIKAHLVGQDVRTDIVYAIYNYVVLTFLFPVDIIRACST